SPLIERSLVLVLAPHILGRATREASNLTLRTLKSMFGGLSRSLEDKSIAEQLPDDVRTARSLLGLDPSTITYAACPDCNRVYPPGGSE
ncbi:hypothetical protein BC834DRAFT_803105, partial [Gloeopeniophorella convolvens]